MCERDRQRETETETDRQTQTGRQGQTDRQTKREELVLESKVKKKFLKLWPKNIVNLQADF